MPLQRRLPKFGFKNINRVEYKAVNLAASIAALAAAENALASISSAFAIEPPARTFTRSPRRRIPLKKMNHTVVKEDTPSVMGMVTKVHHLVKVEKA